MFRFVSVDKRIPDELKLNNKDYEQWDLDEFIKISTSTGLSPDAADRLYMNVDVLSEKLYTELIPYIDACHIVFYKFSDQDITLDFSIDPKYKVRVFDITPEVQEPEEEPIEEVHEEPVQEPVKEEQIEAPAEVRSEPEPGPEPKREEAPVVEEKEEIPEQPVQTIKLAGLNIVGAKNQASGEKLDAGFVDDILNNDDLDNRKKANKGIAKSILFGSSKGGTGKTTTCLMSVYRYAHTHPNEKIAVADFDIIDGQVGITIHSISPTVLDFYKRRKANQGDDFESLRHCAIQQPTTFGRNVDFYLAPPIDIHEVTNDTKFWTDYITLLLSNYDVVFFDSGIDYLGTLPIGQLYKIADKIIITCNPAISSVKSVIKQIQTLYGITKNNIFSKDDNIEGRLYIALTRVGENMSVNKTVARNIQKYAPIIAAFGTIDELINDIQWYGRWNDLATRDDLNEALDNVVELDTDNK